MVEPFSNILITGGHTNYLGRAKEVLDATLVDRSRLEELFECLNNDDAWVRMRAIDSIEKVCRVHPEWLEPYTELLLTELSQRSQASIQWHLAEIFTQIKLTSEQEKRAITWLTERCNDPAIDWIVAANCMDALAHFTRLGLFPVNTIKAILRRMQSHRSKAVNKRATKLLDQFSPKNQTMS